MIKKVTFNTLIRRYFTKDDKRFEVVYCQGVANVIEVLVDKETGVNYLFRKSANAGGLTPLLDKDGKPIITD